ncbi:MAG: hypothetical protein EOO80_06700 [Oxalobacteraceae bacterium]|nr:MAG: hypothetical protein EOO80_06700 [Oxalobacteraceae bacterium]
MKPSQLQQANRRVISAQRLCARALERLRPGDPRTMQRVIKASYLLDIARERFVSAAKQSRLGNPAARRGESLAAISVNAR